MKNSLQRMSIYLHDCMTHLKHLKTIRIGIMCVYYGFIFFRHTQILANSVKSKMFVLLYFEIKSFKLLVFVMFVHCSTLNNKLMSWTDNFPNNWFILCDINSLSLLVFFHDSDTLQTLLFSSVIDDAMTICLFRKQNSS